MPKKRTLLDEELIAAKNAKLEDEKLPSRTGLDFSIPGVRRKYVRDLKRARRRALLPKDLRCPVCGRIELAANKWVVTTIARCRSCWMKEE